MKEKHHIIIPIDEEQHSVNLNKKFFRILRMYQKLVVNIKLGGEILEAMALSSIKTVILAVTVTVLF